MIKIYTDGSSRGNGTQNARGGWAFVIEDNGFFYEESGAQIGATNQQMELLAAIKALMSLAPGSFCEPIVVYTDSAYLQSCWRDKWWQNWEDNGWKNSKKEPVANKGLWETLIPFFKNPNICFKKVKGHSDVERNIYVDHLAQQASSLV